MSVHPGTLLTVTAPPTSEGRRFLRWRVNGVLQKVGVRAIVVTVAEDTTLQALYLVQRPLRPDRPTESDGPQLENQIQRQLDESESKN